MSISFDFSGRTAIISGGGRGIGAELVSLFHDAGASVCVADLATDSISQPWTDSDRVRLIECDVADPRQCDNVVAEALRWTDRLDIVVNNAGITRDGVVWKTTDENWSIVLAVHLTGTFNLTRAAIEPMRHAGHGRIVNVTSYTGVHGNFGQANYAAAKAGIIGFSKAVAKEVARFRITVNVLLPNAATAMVAQIPDERRAALEAQIPLGRFGSPSEMAVGVGYLASDEAAYVTGAVLAIDGGLSM